MWTPDWLYERLPMVYLAAAASCLLLFGRSGATALSAFMLCSAALLTIWQRRSARQSQTRRRAASQTRRRPR